MLECEGWQCFSIVLKTEMGVSEPNYMSCLKGGAVIALPYLFII